MKKYTKKQIQEAIAYWEKRLDERVGPDQSAMLNRVSGPVAKMLDDFERLYSPEKIVLAVKALDSLAGKYREFAKADPECGELAEVFRDAALKVSEAARKAASGGFL